MTKARDLASSGLTLTATTTTADAALAKAGGTMTGNLAMGTNLVDGVDVSARDAVLTDTTTKATAALPKSGGAMTGAITTNSTFDGVDIATRDAVLSSTVSTATNALNNANNALPKEGGAMTGAITTNSTFDGVDVGARNSVLTSTTTTANAALPKAGGTISGNLVVSGNLTTSGETRTTNVNTASSTGTLTMFGGSSNKGGTIELSGGNNTGATGSGIVFKTGASTANPPQRMAIDLNGNVGIGTTSIAYKLDVNGSLSSNGNENVMRIAGADASNAGGVNINTVFGDSAASRVTTFFSIDGQNQASPLAFGTGTTERMRINSSGNVGIGVVPETWNVYSPVLQVGSASTAVYQTDDLNIMSNAYYNSGWKYIATDTATRYQQAGGAHAWSVAASGSADATLSWVTKLKVDADGLKFNADTAAGNALNDYETGTATLTWSGTGGSANTSSTTWNYVKIGNLVTVSGNTSSALPNATGTLILTGLPFTSNRNATGSILYRQLNAPSGMHVMVAFVTSGTTQILPYWSGANVYVQLNSSNFNANGAQDMYLTVSYTTA